MLVYLKMAQSAERYVAPRCALIKSNPKVALPSMSFSSAGNRPAESFKVVSGSSACTHLSFSFSRQGFGKFFTSGTTFMVPFTHENDTQSQRTGTA